MKQKMDVSFVESLIVNAENEHYSNDDDLKFYRFFNLRAPIDGIHPSPIALKKLKLMKENFDLGIDVEEILISVELSKSQSDYARKQLIANDRRRTSQEDMDREDEACADKILYAIENEDLNQDYIDELEQDAESAASERNVILSMKHQGLR